MGSGAGSGPDSQGRAAQDFRLQEQKRMQGVNINKTQERFRRNIEAAQEIESRGNGLGILGGIGQASRDMQSNILRSQSTTAEPVRNDQGRVVGVVGKGLFGGRAYTGQTAYDPIGGDRQQPKDDAAPQVSETREAAIQQSATAPSQTAAARRRILGQGQKGSGTRYFYGR